MPLPTWSSSPGGPERICTTGCRGWRPICPTTGPDGPPSSSGPAGSRGPSRSTNPEGGPVIAERVDPEVLGLDLPRFVVSGQVHGLPTQGTAGGLVHEPAPGERVPADDVDTHAEEPHHHHPDGRPDPDVAPPIDG